MKTYCLKKGIVKKVSRSSNSDKGSLPKIKGKLLLNELMSLHTSFKIGGPADILALPKDVSDLQVLLKWAGKNSVAVFVFGAGTNLLVSDRGIRGVVVQLGSGFEGVRILDSIVQAGAAARLSRVLRKSLGRGLSGLEGLAGIPGTIGGAICMNAGTPLGCIEDTLERVKVVDNRGKVKELPAGKLGLTYRGSAVQDCGLIIAEAAFRLYPKEPDEIDRIVGSLLTMRRRTQPVGVGTAGSAFKNPEGSYAGQILESIGAKGMQVGGARVSGKHANFIENTGDATAEDVRELMTRLQSLVKEKFGIILEAEIHIVGEW